MEKQFRMRLTADELQVLITALKRSWRDALDERAAVLGLRLKKVLESEKESDE